MRPKHQLHTAGKAYVFSFSTLTCGAAFVDPACFEFYLQRLFCRASPFRVQLHAYCLLPDEVMILATPGTPWAIEALLDSLDKSYCDYFNLRFRRYLPKLGGQLMAAMVHDDASLMDCQRYIETEACRQLDCSHPGEYHWSSYNSNAFSTQPRHLIRHRAWNEQASQPSGTLPLSQAYRQFIAEDIPMARNHYLGLSIRHGLNLSCQCRDKPSLRSTRL